MVLDKEEHRTAFLNLMNQATFQGKDTAMVVELFNTLTNATVKEDTHDPDHILRAGS